MKIRNKLYHALTISGEDGLTRILNRFLIAIVLSSIVLVVIETEPNFSAWQWHFETANMIFAGFFSVEYSLRLWVAGEDERYRGFTGRLRYMVSPLALLDLMALIPFYLSFFSEAFILRIVRLVRIITVVKLGRYAPAFHNVMAAIMKRGFELAISFGIAIFAIVLASTAMYILEGQAQPETFGSIPRAMWWGMATLTTIGYGDVYPITVYGKVFTMIYALICAGLVGMVGGIMAGAFSETFQQKVDEDGEYPTDKDYRRYEQAYNKGKNDRLAGNKNQNKHSYSAIGLSPWQAYEDGFSNVQYWEIS